MYSYHLYTPTSINPSDGPTRGRAVPEPLDPLPEWWGDAKLGDFRGLDVLLKECGADPWTLSGIPAFEELRRAAPRALEKTLIARKEKKRPKLRDLLKAPEELDLKKAPEGETSCENDSVDPHGVQRSRGTLVFPEGVDRAECLLRQGYLDLFSGVGAVARELARLSGRWVLSYDILNSKEQDLLKPEVQKEVIKLIKQGSFVGIGAAPVCSSMSRAITPAWRTVAQPEGTQGLSSCQQAKVEAGNQFAKFIAQVGMLCLQLDLPFWFENPWLSFLWWIPSIQSLRSELGVGFWLLDFCAFGTPWRKRTRILTNTQLRGQRTLCPGCKRLQLLRGRSGEHKQSWTKLAEPYPIRLASTIAMALTGSAGDRPEFRDLDATACAKCTHCRIGESKAPGPRKTTATDRARSRSGLRLSDVNLVEQKTVQLETRLWEGFVDWLTEDCELESVETLLAAAVTVAPLLQLYGDHLSGSGATLTATPRCFCHSKVC